MKPDATILLRFAEYVRAFEKTYLDADWTRIEPYFDAVTGGRQHVVGL